MMSANLDSLILWTREHIKHGALVTLDKTVRRCSCGSEWKAMLEFESVDRYALVSSEREIRGFIGTTFSVAGIENFNPREIQVNTQVVLNGQVVTVVGVETFAIPDVTGRPFGLLVKE